MLRDGIGVKRDINAGIKWLKLAVRQRNLEAVRDLGYAYHEGLGVTKNLNLATKYYKLAAKSGDKKAQRNLSLCYKNGEGVTASTRWFKYWQIKASEKRTRLYSREMPQS